MNKEQILDRLDLLLGEPLVDTLTLMQQLMADIQRDIELDNLKSAGIVGSPVEPDPQPTPPVIQQQSKVDLPPTRLIPWGEEARRKYGMRFIEGVLWIESQLGLRADILMACMKFESDLDHKARNPHSSASGLIQFMAQTAKNLGTTIEHIRGLDAMGQLAYVYKYFADFDKQGHQLESWDVADAYMAILWPAAIGKPLDHPIFVMGRGGAYAVNKGLDFNRDGMVTKREAASKVLRVYQLGLEDEHVLVRPN